MSEPGDRGKTRLCASCRALNGADFDRCIRCGSRLDQAPQPPAERLRVHVGGEGLWATKGIVAFTLLIYALQIMAMTGHGAKPDLLQLLFSGGSAKELLRFGALIIEPDRAAAAPFRLLSAVFVHVGLLHVGMNMLGLSNLGRIAEPAVGSARLLVAYVVTGVAGFATSVAWAAAGGMHGAITAGASGAVFGVMGVILGWMLRRRDPRWKQFAVQAVFYSVIFGFAMNASHSGIQVNNSAHIGGLACGTIFGLIYAGRRAQTDLWANIAAGISIAACAASLLLSQRAAPAPVKSGPLDGLLEIRPEPR
jgi:membrane associated rhomboid family serine protease